MPEVLFQHEIKDFSVVQIFVICSASHCSTEAFCLVLLPAMIEFPIGFVRFVGMVEWGAGRTAAWPEGSSSCCSYCLWCGNSRGHSHGAGPEHGRLTVKTLSLPLKFTLPTRGFIIQSIWKVVVNIQRSYYVACQEVIIWTMMMWTVMFRFSRESLILYSLALNSVRP